MKVSIYLLIFFVFFLTACEGFVGGSGTVTDQNGNPIPDVPLLLTIRGNTLDTIFYTDSMGQYKISRLVGCVPKCPTAEIKFVKSGYNSNIISGNPEVIDTIIILKRKD